MSKHVSDDEGNMTKLTRMYDRDHEDKHRNHVRQKKGCCRQKHRENSRICVHVSLAEWRWES
jgi:hypothetical protein